MLAYWNLSVKQSLYTSPQGQWPDMKLHLLLALVGAVPQLVCSLCSLLSHIRRSCLLTPATASLPCLTCHWGTHTRVSHNLETPRCL